MLTDLKPCPWCNSTEYLSVQSVGSMTADMPAWPHRVICIHIDHETVCGPVAYGKTAAVMMWDKRPGGEWKPIDKDTPERRVIVCGWNPPRGDVRGYWYYHDDVVMDGEACAHPSATHWTEFILPEKFPDNL